MRMGAKTGMERSLASIAPEGWLPMAAAMLGTVDKPRPVVGTTIDFKALPPILSETKNCSCSRAGNSGIQPVYRALPCLNGLLESKWSMGLMGLIPRLI